MLIELTPTQVDIAAVAAALDYKNTASVANRIRALKKKFELQVTCTGAAGGASGGTTSNPATPRKGAKVSNGPIKAKPEPGTPGGDDDAGEAATPPKSAKKTPAARKPRKPSAAALAKAAKEQAEAEAEAEATKVKEEENDAEVPAKVEEE